MSSLLAQVISPSFSWSDLNASLQHALSTCDHCELPHGSECCALCLLQAVQRHVADSTIIQNITPSPPKVTQSLSDLESSLGSFSQIGGNEKLKEYLMEAIVKPCLEWKV